MGDIGGLLQTPPYGFTSLGTSPPDPRRGVRTSTMRAHVIVDLGRGPCTLGAGDLVGRAWCASLYLDDPRISEAHAMVSLRGERLRLLALRGRFAVDGSVVGEVDLHPGQRIVLAPPDLGFDVLEVVLPGEIAAIRADGGAPMLLHGASALVLDPEPALRPPTAPDAGAWLWPGRDGWRIRLPGEGDRPIVFGDRFTIGARSFELVTWPLAPTAATRAGLQAPLRLVARWETVHIHRADAPPVVIDGVPARLVSELAALRVPVAWAVLANELWPSVDAGLARKRLDGALARLRTTLRESNLRSDLVRTNGQGQIELMLEPGDVVEDQL